MWNKIKIQLLVILEFIKHWFGKFLTELPGMWKLLKVWVIKFIAWRKARFERHRKLVWYRKIINAFLTFIVLFLLYLFIVDINFLWLFGKITRTEKYQQSESKFSFHHLLIRQ